MNIKVECEGCGFEFTTKLDVVRPEDAAESVGECIECGSTELFFFDVTPEVTK